MALKAQRSRSQSTSIPAPITGWNARDALGAMPETDAIKLTNWFPMPTQVALRQGSLNWATGLPSQVNTVMGYNSGTGHKLFAASNTGIYDCTAGGAVGVAVQTISNDKLIYTNFATAGGNFLVCCNGSDSVLNYNGTTWSNPSITGVTSASLNYVYPTKARLWFIEKASLRVWYLPVNSIAGTASAIDLSSLCRHGGYLVSMTSWTATGGFGTTDYTLFVTSEGEMLIYQGIDPSSATTWSLVGIWKFGSPMGNKCFTKFGADVLYLSKDGLVPVTKGKFVADTNVGEDISNKIQSAISDVTTTYANNFGWSVTIYPLNNMLILNVPKGAGLQEQYVMNTITNAWCNFTSWYANTWEVYQDNIYYGGNGVVTLAWSGYSDNGTQILGDAIQAANYFGEKGILKRWTMMRPIISSNGKPSIYANINVDFDTTQPANILSYSGASTTATFDLSKWDVAVWGQDNTIYKDWQGINGVGYTASPRFKAAGIGIAINWISTDFVFEKGSIL